MRRLLLTLTIAACGTSASPSAPKRLVFEAYSVPQLTSRDVFVAAAGDVIVMAHRVSKDGGVTWKDLDPRLGTPARVALHDHTATLYANGLVQWDLASDAITAVSGAPSFTNDRSWRVDPAGKLLVFDPIANAIASEAAGWRVTSLPPPRASETNPYIQDLESNGSTILAVSAWGVHRSRDGGASWELVADQTPQAGRDVLVLRDGRFLLFGGMTSYVFDATGAPAGTRPGVVADQGDASVCDDGAIVVHDTRTTDLGASWKPLLAGGDLALTVERIGCGGGRYWMLARSDAWGYRLLSFTPGAPLLAAGNWEGATSWTGATTPIARTPDGTFLVAGLAWRDGDAAWSLREIPPRTWAVRDLAFGIASAQFYASRDAGTTWNAMKVVGATPAAADADAFVEAPDGTLLLSTFTGGTTDGVDHWHGGIYASHDGGGSWAVAYDAFATRASGGNTDGEVHRFVGVAPDGTWVATDAISRDGGQTWKASAVKNDRSLAFLTPGGRLVVEHPGDSSDVWRVYDRAGAELVDTYELAIDAMPVAGSSLQSVVFDDAGYAYIAGGAPYVQLWRSDQPLD